MRNFDKTGEVIKDFNDIKTHKVYEVGEKFTANRWRYDDLYYKGFLTKGEEVKKKPVL